MRMNITARMLSLQAPGNWTPKESEGFFTRHFYRAVFQRLLVDFGVLPAQDDGKNVSSLGNGDISQGLNGEDEDDLATHTVTIGSLRPSAYASFAAYVRAATTKVRSDAHFGRAMAAVEHQITDAVIAEYEERYAGARKELSMLWVLMAVSAAVVESVVLVDRWQWVREELERGGEKGEAWVVALFDYAISPRNMVVVGVAGGRGDEEG